MKTTLNIREDLLAEAMNCTGLREKTAVIHLGLEGLIRRAAAQRLIKLGGSMPKAKASSRRKRGVRPVADLTRKK